MINDAFLWLEVAVSIHQLTTCVCLDLQAIVVRCSVCEHDSYMCVYKTYYQI